MIKIYEMTKEFFDKHFNNGDNWDFPISELDYLLREHDGESFALIGDRLYELQIDL